MSYGQGHYDRDRVHGALSVVAKWMAGRDIKVNYHGGTKVSANIFKGILHIPALACSMGISEKALTLIRGNVYHEAGHILKTELSESEYPKGALHTIFNAIEDLRMERAVASDYEGAGPIFLKNNRYYNNKIAQSVIEGKKFGALWEALTVMMFRSTGIEPKWRISEKSQYYIEVAYSKFCEWRGTTSAASALKLSYEIYDLLKEANDNYNSGNEEDSDDNEKEESGEENAPDDDSGDSDSNSSSGPAGDFDEDEKEGEGAGSSNGGDDDEDEGSDSSSGDEEEENTGGSDDEGSSSEGEQGGGDNSDSDDEDGSPEGGGADIEDEVDGPCLEDFQNEDIESELENLDPEDKKYLSFKENDIHEYIESSPALDKKYLEMRKGVAAEVSAMILAMEQAMRARARCRTRRYRREGRIDHSRLASIGKSLSKDVFKVTSKGEDISTAVEIIIDESGSMGKDLEKAKAVTIAVSEAMNSLGIPFEVIGSTISVTHMRMGCFDRVNPIIYRHYKSFNEKWPVVCSRIAYDGSHVCNVDGEVVDYAARRLLTRNEDRKIIISLCDGLPNAGHNNNHVMAANLTRCCERARKNGVEVYAFGIGTQRPAKYYGEENFLMIDRGDGLGPAFTRRFVEVLSGGRFKVGVV